MKQASVEVSKVQNVKSENIVGHGSKESCVFFYSNDVVTPVEGPSRMTPTSSCYKTRLFYNSNVKPSDVEAILANRGRKNKKLIDKRVVKSMIFRGVGSAGSSNVMQYQCKESQDNDCKNVQITDCVFTNGHDLFHQKSHKNLNMIQNMSALKTNSLVQY